MKHKSIELAEAALTIEEVKLANKRLALTLINEKLLDFPYDINISFGYGAEPFSLDFDYTNRETTLALITHLQVGKWEKELSGSININYINKTAYDFTLRIYGAEPPASCKIITEEIVIPQQVIPSYVKTQYRMECKPE